MQLNASKIKSFIVYGSNKTFIDAAYQVPVLLSLNLCNYLGSKVNTYNAISCSTNYGVQYPGYIFSGTAGQCRTGARSWAKPPPVIHNQTLNNRAIAYPLM